MFNGHGQWCEIANSKHDRPSENLALGALSACFAKAALSGARYRGSPAGGAYFFLAEKVAKMRLRPTKMAKERHDCGTREKLANAQTVPRVFRILSRSS